MSSSAIMHHCWFLLQYSSAALHVCLHVLSAPQYAILRQVFMLKRLQVVD